MANLELSFPGVDEAFVVRRFDVVEGLSVPFEATLAAAASDPDLDFDALLGRALTFTILGGSRGERAWTGVCASIEQLDVEPEGAAIYRLRLVPRLWLLGKRRGHRVFLRRSTVEIVRTILAEHGIEVDLRLDPAGAATHEHRIQHGETDLAFVRRLLEDAGITHFIEGAKVVLADAPEHAEARVLAHAALLRGADGVRFTSERVDLAPGAVVSIDGARLCIATTHLAGLADGEWTTTARAVSADRPVRPTAKTRRPTIHGVESARVVGPVGEEIHTDAEGRVRLHFPWDREGGREGGNDETRAPWARVAAGWAGAGWGMLTLPRVGHEVLVAFVEGNPDAPVVVGRAYGTANPPPHSLPGAAAMSAWRSASTPGAEGAHELLFDDRHGHERLGIASSRDLTTVVHHDRVDTVGHDADAHIGGHLGVTITGEDRIDVGHAHRVAHGGTHREIVAKRITLTTGAATITLDGPDLTVSGPAGVRIVAGGTVSIQGEPQVHINPPQLDGGAAPAAPPASSHVVWFRLMAEGEPLAAARCHIERDDGSASATHVTDGQGYVRFPVDGAGDYHLKIGKAPSAPKVIAAPETAPAPETPPATPSAPKAIHVGTTPAQPTTHAQPTVHPVPIRLEIVAPRPHTTFHLHSTPSMPTVPLEARVLVHGEPVEIGSVRWELQLGGTYRVRDASDRGYRQQPYRLAAGHTRSLPGEVKHFQLAPGALVGGELTVKAIFHGGAELGGATASKAVHGCAVLGKSAPRAAIEAFIVARAGHLAWLYLRIFCHESAHTLEQFARGSGGGNTPGYPLYGPPSGVGIVQRDPTAPEWHFPRHRVSAPNNFFPRIFWDWKANLEEGISSFHHDYLERGRRDLDALRAAHPHLPMYPEGVLYRAAIRRYNGGIEFGASADGRHYVVHPLSTNNPGYVDAVLGDPHIDAHHHPVPEGARATTWPR